MVSNSDYPAGNASYIRFVKTGQLRSTTVKITNCDKAGKYGGDNSSKVVGIKASKTPVKRVPIGVGDHGLMIFAQEKEQCCSLWSLVRSTKF